MKKEFNGIIEKYWIIKKSRIKFNESATLSVILMLLARLWVLNLMLNHTHTHTHAMLHRCALRNHRLTSFIIAKTSSVKPQIRKGGSQERERERAFLPLAWIAILKSVSDDAEIPRAFCYYRQFLFFTLLSFIVPSIKISIGKNLYIITVITTVLSDKLSRICCSFTWNI